MAERGVPIRDCEIKRLAARLGLARENLDAALGTSYKKVL
jgi:hypothetical protein